MYKNCAMCIYEFIHIWSRNDAYPCFFFVIWAARAFYVHPKHNGLAYIPKWGHIYTLPWYKRQFGLFGGACALWSLNINHDTDNIDEIPAYSMHLGPFICTMDSTIQYKQPTVQFDQLACSICVDFACFYVEFAFRHYAKKSWKSKLKKINFL